MADDAPAAEEAPITFSVKASNDAKYTLTLPLATPILDLKEKLASSEYADTPVERQRLIYSGRVLKDHDTLATYKVKDSHTIHLVKSAASNQRQGQGQSSASTSTSAPTGGTSQPAAAPGVPTNLASGTGNNPLAGLTGARYAGFAQLPGASMFGPDGGMGPPPDSESMIHMLENPQFQSTMNEALQNPTMIDMMIQQNPMLREMGPGVRQMMQTPEFRRMLTDPNSIRQAMEMQRAMGGLGGGGGSPFPAPGPTNTSPEEGGNPPAPAANPFLQAAMGSGNPLSSLFGGNPNMGANPTPTAPNTSGSEQAGGAAAGGGPNPFGFLANPGLFGGQGAQGGFNPLDPQQNPFLRDPAAASQLLQAAQGEGGAGGAANPLAALLGGAGGGGFGGPPDNRPPEERYATQLGQLNEMGFCEFERNVEALRRAGGSTQGAVEYLLSHPS